jgi:hypothetical protein
MARYQVEQVGHRDYAVWDDKDERWVVTATTQDDAEGTADRLNNNS